MKPTYLYNLDVIISVTVCGDWVMCGRDALQCVSTVENSEIPIALRLAPTKK